MKKILGFIIGFVLIFNTSCYAANRVMAATQSYSAPTICDTVENTFSCHATTNITISTSNLYTATFTSTVGVEMTGVVVYVTAVGTGGTITAYLQEYNGATWSDVAGGEGTNTIAWSIDGLSWTGLGTSIFSTAGTSIAWNGTYWVSGGSGTNTSAWSLDGINWTGNGATIMTTQVSGIASPTPLKSVVPNIGFTLDNNTRYNIRVCNGIA
jgi:hypothetical protein